MTIKLNDVTGDIKVQRGMLKN